MKITRATAARLGSIAGIAAVAGACHYFHLGELPGLLGTGLALSGEGTQAWFGHLGAEAVKDVVERVGKETPRGVQNRDLHRLVGEAIASILERETKSAPGGKYGAAYLKEAAATFRGDNWMDVELTGPEIAVSEPNVAAYFTGDVDTIQHTPVLEQAEWKTLVEKVLGGTTTIREHDEALNFAAEKLRNGFAAELWEVSKNAWKKNELAWPALNLRLLSLILGHVGGTEGEVSRLREQVALLRDALSGFAACAAGSVGPGSNKEMLLEAIREYQDDLSAKLDELFASLHKRLDKQDRELRNIQDLLEESKIADRSPSDLAVTIDSHLLESLNGSRMQCIKQDVPFRTPNVMLTLLDMASGFTEKAFNAAKDGLGSSLRKKLRLFVTERQIYIDREKGLRYENIDWFEYDFMQLAAVEARREGCPLVMEKHLLLGVLQSTSSQTVKALRAQMGEKNFDTLIALIRADSGTPISAL